MTSPHNERAGEPQFYSDLPPTCLHAVCSDTDSLPNTQSNTHCHTGSLLECKSLRGNRAFSVSQSTQCWQNTLWIKYNHTSRQENIQGAVFQMKKQQWQRSRGPRAPLQTKTSIKSNTRFLFFFSQRCTLSKGKEHLWHNDVNTKKSIKMSASLNELITSQALWSFRMCQQNFTPVYCVLHHTAQDFSHTLSTLRWNNIHYIFFSSTAHWHCSLISLPQTPGLSVWKKGPAVSLLCSHSLARVNKSVSFYLLQILK